jgi:hypothetical protein
MANFEVLSLDPTTPQIRAPGAGDGYSVPRDMTVASGANLTLSGGTANGVLYLNASKVATSGSALTFDGTGKFGVGTATPVGGVSSGFEAVGEIWASTAASNANQIRLSPSTSGANIIYSTYAGSGSYLPLAFNVSGSEQMRLTSTGLGIGTTSPASRLDVRNTGGTYDKGISIQTASAGNIGTIWTSLTDLNIGIAGAHKFTNFDGSATRMTLDSSGNLGLGVTPSAWRNIINAFQVGGTGAAIYAYTSAGTGQQDFNISNNSFENSSGNDIYIRTNPAAKYQQFNNQHRWYNAASGTAGNTITFTQAMTLDASGNLGIGTTSPGQKLEVAGNQRFTGSQVGTKIENRQTGVSVSTATTILDDAGSLGRFVVVNGEVGGDRFCDLVLCSTAVSPTVVSSFTALGSPAARTYTRSGSALQLAMAAGTYTVHALALGY